MAAGRDDCRLVQCLLFNAEVNCWALAVTRSGAVLIIECHPPSRSSGLLTAWTDSSSRDLLHDFKGETVEEIDQKRSAASGVSMGSKKDASCRVCGGMMGTLSSPLVSWCN